MYAASRCEIQSAGAHKKKSGVDAEVSLVAVCTRACRASRPSLTSARVRQPDRPRTTRTARFRCLRSSGRRVGLGIVPGLSFLLDAITPAPCRRAPAARRAPGA